MAVYETCGKKPQFGNARSFSMRATRRQFKPNIQRITVVENGRTVRKNVCAKCIKTMSKV